MLSACDDGTKSLFLLTLVMVLLHCSAATKRFCTTSAPFNHFNCFKPQKVAFITRWATPRQIIFPKDSRAIRAQVNPLVGMRKLQPHYVAAGENVSTLADDPLSSTDEASDTKTKKSRKKRARDTKKANLQRIDKVLAHRGVGTRSQTFELAKAKRIAVASRPDAPHEERTRLRGPKEKVPYNAALFLDGTLLPGPPPLLLAYHKPKYVLSVMEDEKKYEGQNRKHLGQVLEPRFIKAGMHPVGRLDYDTTGLILFSLDGTLTQRLLHPRRGVEKEYLATVQGLADEGVLAQKLSDGVQTSEGVHKAKLVSVAPSDGPMSDDELHGFDENEEEEIQADYSGPLSDVRLIVKEGKYRMVRRILANCGHPVEELRRLRHGIVELGDLKVGEFREATEEELEWAQNLINK